LQLRTEREWWTQTGTHSPHPPMCCRSHSDETTCPISSAAELQVGTSPSFLSLLFTTRFPWGTQLPVASLLSEWSEMLHDSNQWCVSRRKGKNH
jgi:hypothetical protein